jgi:hypothetical protein
VLEGRPVRQGKMMFLMGREANVVSLVGMTSRRDEEETEEAGEGVVLMCRRGTEQGVHSEVAGT